MDNLKTTRKIFFTLLLLSVLSFPLLTFSSAIAQGPPRIKIEAASPQRVSLTVGKSIIVQSPEPVKRLSLAAPEIADAVILTSHQIYVTGKAPGTTNLTLWVDNKVSAIIDLEVSSDVSRIKESIYRIFPEERDIKVSTNHHDITLSGTVSSSSNLSQVVAIAQSYVPKDGKVINLLEVAGVHQVMLEVRVSEMSRSLLRRLGMNFAAVSSSGHNVGLSLLNNLTSLPAGGFPTNPLGVSTSIDAVIRFVTQGATWTVFIDALKDQGLVKVLAEPTLITLSGKSANFLAGGEFPIPVPQLGGAGFATITIEYKPFGVGLNFTPTVLSNKKISMHVAPEVSQLDFTRAVTISGFVVPAITTRRASTVVELADGQSFAIAGLISEELRENIAKFPVLGDIPILGALFRSSSFQKNETELVIVVTPHLVKPLDIAKQTLPTDQFIEPDEFEFYLLGNLEGKEKIKPAAYSGDPRKGYGLEGNFGHIVPK